MMAKSLIVGLSAMIGAEASLTDLQRARTKVPGSHVKGEGYAGMNSKMNSWLSSLPGLQVQPCEAFTTADLTELLRALFANREPSFQAIYQANADSRKLDSEDPVTLEKLWAKEEQLLVEHPVLHDVSRDGKCHKVIMWMVHHLSENHQHQLRKTLTFPLLPSRVSPHEEITFSHNAPTAAVSEVFGAYFPSLTCNECHNNAYSTKGNTEYTPWPAEVEYTATGHGPFPFWDNTGKGCASCDRTYPGSNSSLRVKLSATKNAEILMHESCSDMSWTGAADAPNKSPCNSIFTATGSYIYTPTTALNPEADGKFCCKMYTAADSAQFSGAVPCDWMKSMSYKGTKSDFNGDHYSGTVKIYEQDGFLGFWYLESEDGKPVEQGEGCAQPGGAYPSAPCASAGSPFLFFHDFNQSSFKATSFTDNEFAIPSACQTTTISCTAPGGSTGLTRMGGRPGTWAQTSSSGTCASANPKSAAIVV